jgi:RNA polymerase sigma factor (sigma-70 family)
MAPLPPFEHLVREHGPDLHRFLVAGVGPHDADDCFQEVVLSALRTYPHLRDASNLRGWLFTIAYRKAIDSHRGAGRQRTLVAAAGARLGGADAVAPPAGDEDEADLWVHVRRLPPKQRAAVLHRYLHDLPYRDIGAVIGCREAAARQNVRAGLAALRKVLEP